ncbi:hypothetical protein DPMN_110963 [Dreissena polymorpha]|uniref:Uncharacterized protein n=1 Tax=Dreissena polymorpha TaxID=45954 RepID=A0A9D4QNJ9_DREPO|nr:hypothetical protein DPMN_110963 [Dreissena polymorpha]
MASSWTSYGLAVTTARSSGRTRVGTGGASGSLNILCSGCATVAVRVAVGRIWLNTATVASQRAAWARQRQTPITNTARCGTI